MKNFVQFLSFRRNLYMILTILSIYSCGKKELNGYEIDCNSAKKQAQNDFKYQNYTWSDFGGFGFDFFGEDEFIELLKNNNIKYKFVPVSCIVTGYEKFENCYEREMQQLLNEKFGKKFFDSLKIVAKKEYVLKRKDSIFHFGECDQTSRHPKTNDYGEQFKLKDKEFFQNFTYPENYMKRQSNDYYSYTSTSFILMKDGTTKNFETETTFQNPKNKIFEKSFNQKVEDYTKSIKWKPATIEGIPVNSYMEVTIHYE